MNKRIVAIGLTMLFIMLNAASIISVVTVANPGYITVYNPAPGNTYYEGDTVPITWTSSEEYVKIELYKSGIYHSTISYNTTNDGSFSWVIPYGYASSSHYQIKIINLADESEYDYSGFFLIQERYITVTSPSSTDELFIGDTFTILWDFDNVGSYVTIELYRTGLYYSTIASNYYSYDNYYSDTSYSWTIPSDLPTGEKYQIRKTDSQGNRARPFY